MIQCNHCGATIKDTAVFCRYCGQKTDRTSELDTSQLTAEQFYVMSEKIKSTISDLTEAYAKGIAEKSAHCEALKEKTDRESAQLCSSLEKLRAEFEDLKTEKASMDKLVATLAAEKQGLLTELQKAKAAQDEAESRAAASLAAAKQFETAQAAPEHAIAQEPAPENKPDEPQELTAEKPIEKKRRKSAPKQTKSSPKAALEEAPPAPETAPPEAMQPEAVQPEPVSEQESGATSATQSGNCPKCGAATDPEMAFCAECGESLR